MRMAARWWRRGDGDSSGNSRPAENDDITALPAGKVLALRQHQPLQVPFTDAVMLNASIGFDGTAVCLWAAPGDADALRGASPDPGGAYFPDSVSTGPVPAVVTLQSSGPAQVIALPDLPFAHAKVQPLPDGGILLAGARCYYDHDTRRAEHNAAIFDDDGRLLRSGSLGDGIAHLRVTRAGKIWVGYFDEGIFGNYGWGESGGPDPIGRAGLVRFGADLVKEWELPCDDETIPSNTDCYALNVYGNTLWTSYDGDFPVVRVNDDVLTVWRNGERPDPVSVLLVADATAGLLSFPKAGARVVLADLSDGEVVPRSTAAIAVDHRALTTRDLKFVAEGSSLHGFGGGWWFRADLDDVA